MIVNSQYVTKNDRLVARVAQKAALTDGDLRPVAMLMAFCVISSLAAIINGFVSSVASNVFLACMTALIVGLRSQLMATESWAVSRLDRELAEQAARARDLDEQAIGFALREQRRLLVTHTRAVNAATKALKALSRAADDETIDVNALTEARRDLRTLEDGLANAMIGLREEVRNHRAALDARELLQQHQARGLPTNLTRALQSAQALAEEAPSQHTTSARAAQAAENKEAIIEGVRAAGVPLF